MEKLPIISGEKVIKVLKKAGFVIDNIKGDHVVLINKNASSPKIISVPLKREIKKGTLMNIIKHSGLSKEEFIALIKK
ncbi:MAG: type II toxin-antitoxin system HicA family toxin [Candidatus Methanospirareceae archaeon]